MQKLESMRKILHTRQDLYKEQNNKPATFLELGGGQKYFFGSEKQISECCKRVQKLFAAVQVL